MKPRPKKCKACGEKFAPFNSMQKACSIQCAQKVAKSALERKERKAIAEYRERLKTRTDWLGEAQQAFNAYIRVRDAGKPCISCDKPDNGSHQRHASHFRSVKACSVLRFNTFNVWASCSTCNSHLSGNLLEYRIRLVKKLGPDRVEWLECQNAPCAYSIEYAQRLKRIFNKRARLYAKLRDKRASL